MESEPELVPAPTEEEKPAEAAAEGEEAIPEEVVPDSGWGDYVEQPAEE